MAERGEADDAGYYVSSYSGTGNCVAVRRLASGSVVVKHSQTAGPRLRFTQAEWSAFLAGVKAGEFDNLPTR